MTKKQLIEKCEKLEDRIMEVESNSVSNELYWECEEQVRKLNEYLDEVMKICEWTTSRK